MFFYILQKNLQPAADPEGFIISRNPPNQKLEKWIGKKLTNFSTQNAKMYKIYTISNLARKISIFHYEENINRNYKLQ